MSDCLLLNSDASPVTMLPLSVIPWQDAIRYMVLEKATVLEWHEEWIVRSARWETPVPAVIILKEYYKKKGTIRFSKMNVFLRDNFTCQYCGVGVNRRTATLDHVLPTSLPDHLCLHSDPCDCEWASARAHLCDRSVVESPHRSCICSSDR